MLFCTDAAVPMAATLATCFKILASYINNVASYIRSYTAMTITLALLRLSPAETRNHVIIITSYKDNIGDPQ